MARSPMHRPALSSPKAAAAVMAAFVANGLGAGAVGGLVPSLTTTLDTNAQGIGLLLVVFGLAAIIGINVGGRVSDAHGAIRPVQVGLLLMAAGAVAVALSTSLPVGMLVGFLYGVGNGMTDVSMNAMGVQVEQARPRPLMSRFHATFSIGMFLGAGVVLLLGAAGMDPRTLVLGVFGLVAILLVVAAVLTELYAAQTVRVTHVAEGRRVAIPKAAWVLAVMAICFGITEGTANDWSAVHVSRVANVGDGMGAWGLACFSGCMVVMRLLGDHIVHRLGRRAVVRWGAALAVVGYVIGILATPLPLLLLGWCIVGAGVALVAPQIYGLAGQNGGGRTLSVVVTTGYTAMLIGPGVMGSLVHHFGIQDALLFPLVLGICLSALSIVMPAGRSAGPVEAGDVGATCEDHRHG